MFTKSHHLYPTLTYMNPSNVHTQEVMTSYAEAGNNILVQIKTRRLNQKVVMWVLTHYR
jgi:hypothetical protein